MSNSSSRSPAALPSSSDTNSSVKRLAQYGTAATVFYLGIFCGVLLHVGLAPFIGRSFNMWGDFLAGLFGPLAFLWLVLGYRQQGEELRLNTEALRQQADRLEEQVSKTRELAEQTKRQADVDEERRNREIVEEKLRLRPVFCQADENPFDDPAGGTGVDEGTLKVTITNTGGEARNLKIDDKLLSVVEIRQGSLVPHDRDAMIYVNFISVLENQNIGFDLAYEDVLGNSYCDGCIIDGDGKFVVVDPDSIETPLRASVRTGAPKVDAKLPNIRVSHSEGHKESH